MGENTEVNSETNENIAEIASVTKEKEMNLEYDRLPKVERTSSRKTYGSYCIERVTIFHLTCKCEIAGLKRTVIDRVGGDV